jgi:hypothetical protein
VAQRAVRSANGAVSVMTTERGLPIALRLEQSELTKPPAELAREILALCRLSAARMQLARRRELESRGFGNHIIRDLNLATDDDVASAEEAAYPSDEDPPQSWMRSV